jgi:hypothetical protein
MGTFFPALTPVRPEPNATGQVTEQPRKPHGAKPILNHPQG